MGHHFISGADAPRVSQPVQMLDVTPAIIPHLRQIYKWREERRQGRESKKKKDQGVEVREEAGRDEKGGGVGGGGRETRITQKGKAAQRCNPNILCDPPAGITNPTDSHAHGDSQMYDGM